MGGVPLAKAINELRGQIEQAERDAADERLQFELGQVELELKVQLSEEGKIKGGFKAWVIEFGAEDKVSEASTHTVKLTLSPKLKDGGELRVGARVTHDPRRDGR